MLWREELVEYFASDLEYNPRKALVYVLLGLGSICYWILISGEGKFTNVHAIFALGSITLLIKGIFLLRKSSEGIGLTEPDLQELAKRSRLKHLPSTGTLAGQILRDFGIGATLLWPIVYLYASDVETKRPTLSIFFIGIALAALGWFLERQTKKSEVGSQLS